MGALLHTHNMFSGGTFYRLINEMLFYKPEKVDYSIYKRLSYMGVKCK
jgi:hypothetical protein